MTQEHRRLELLDSLRGLALVNMVLYHGLWDQVYLVSTPAWYSEVWAYPWQQWICHTFILLSGFCWSLSRRHLRHGLTNLGCGFLVTAVTLVALPASPIWWGVLYLLGASALLLLPLSRILERVPPVWGLFFSAVLFALTRRAQTGVIGLKGLFSVPLPRFLFANQLTAALGFPPAGFLSSDYFPLIPWFFLFAFGYFLYRAGEEKWQDSPVMHRRIPGLDWLGRHSLAVYLLHQPIVYLLVVVL